MPVGRWLRHIAPFPKSLQFPPQVSKPVHTFFSLNISKGHTPNFLAFRNTESKKTLMINKKLAFGFIAVVAFATPAAAQQSQLSVQSANTQNAAVNGSTAISNTELHNQQIQLERDGFYNYEPQGQVSIQESNTSNAAVNGSSAFSNTELNSQQIQVEQDKFYSPYFGH